MCRETSNRCNAFVPYIKKNKKTDKKTQVAGVTSATDSSRYVDANNKIYYKLSEEVINNMVKHLKN